MMPMDSNEKMFAIIENYLNKNHAPTHSNYSLKLLEVYEVEKANEKAQFVETNNKMLLWHGSRLTNWAGILSQGLLNFILENIRK